MHTFVGEPGPTSTQTPTGLRALSTHPCADVDLGSADGDGDGQPDGVQHDNSDYWSPALHSTNIAPVNWWAPYTALVYYRNAGVAPSSISGFNQNLSLRAGDPNATLANPQPDGVETWSCVAEKHAGFPNNEINFGKTIPSTCPLYLDPVHSLYPFNLRLVVYFPNCFDPSNVTNSGGLWTPNSPHYAEVSSSLTPPYTKTCSRYHGAPQSGYQAYPQVQVGFRWALQTGHGITNNGTNWDLSTLKLSSDQAAGQDDGVTAHMDFMSGWSTAEITRLMADCYTGYSGAGHNCGTIGGDLIDTN